MLLNTSRNYVICMFLLFAIFTPRGPAGTARAATITWGSARTFNDGPDVNPSNYTLVDAVTLYGSSNLTLNGVTFKRYTNSAGSYPAKDYYFADSSIQYDAIWADTDRNNGFAAASTPLEKLLSWGVGNGNHDAGKQIGIVKIGGLTIGQNYQIQAIAHVWYHDGARNRSTYSDDITDRYGQTLNGNNVQIYCGQWNTTPLVDPQYVLGTFTAASTNEEFICLYNSGIYGYMPSALAVYNTAGSGVGSNAPAIQNEGASNLTPTSAFMNGNLTDTGSVPTFVWLYWGDNDGQDTGANWDNTNAFGQSAAGSLATNIAGLGGSSTYYYRYFASNAAGTAWASPSITMTLPTAPVITNTPPTGLTAQWVYMNGVVMSTGGATTRVWLYWGDDDGQEGAWDHTENLGVKGTGTISFYAYNLTGSTTYYYRYFASNVAGTVWAGPSSSLKTWTTITWGSTQTFMGATSVCPDSAYPFVVDAVTCWNSNLTVNGVDFNGYTSYTGAWNNGTCFFGASTTMVNLLWVDTFGSDSFHLLGVYTPTNTEVEMLLAKSDGNGNKDAGPHFADIVLGGLETGRHYQVQLIAPADGYVSSVNTKIENSVGLSNGKYTVSGKQYDPTFVLGTFTADATVRKIELWYGPSEYMWIPAAIGLYTDRPFKAPEGTAIMIH